MTTGLRIAERRKRLELSQEELAYRIGTNQRQVSRYERGANDPTGEVLVKIADALDTTIDYLMGRTSTPDRDSHSQNDLSEDEAEIIRLIRRAKPEKRSIMRSIIRELAEV